MGAQRALHWAIGVDDELRISARAVEEMKMGAALGVSTVSMTDALNMMRVKQFRRETFIEAAIRLAGQMADAMEDAEGWHDASRVEPARARLGESLQRPVSKAPAPPETAP
jgi:hypothetical protein